MAPDGLLCALKRHSPSPWSDGWFLSGAVIQPKDWLRAARPKPTLILWPESDSNALVTCRSAESGH